MKLYTEQVTKLAITEVPNMDHISVIVEDFGPGAGKITITSCGQAWTNFWGHMGKQHTLRSFFCKCNTPYLVEKLQIGIDHQIPDEDSEALSALLCKTILQRRREGDLGHDKARDLWDDAKLVYFGDHSDLCQEVLGDEWWDQMPKKSNPEYEWLTKIVVTVKAAFALEMSEATA